MNKRHEKAAQRKFIKKYGCDPLEVWNIDTWLAKALSHRLYVWLETGVSGHPVNVEYEIYLQELKTVPQDALNDWINSPEHFKALINPEFDNIGIGLCPKLYPGYTQAVNFWVVDFGYDMV
jgi:hypothetical protein